MYSNISLPLPSFTSKSSKEMQSSNYILGSLLTFVILCGVCGNLLVVYAIWKERRLLKSNYYYLVLNLAVCDAFHVLTALRLNYPNYFQTWLLTQTAACKIWLYFEMLLCNCGVQLMVIICFFRYRAVLQPLKTPGPRRKLELLPLLLFITVSIYLIPYVLTFEYNPSKGCYQKWSNKTLRLVYTSFSFDVHFLVPVTIMSVLYSKICRALILQANKMNSILQAETVSGVQDSRSATVDHFQRIRHHRNTRTFLVSAVSVGIFTIAVLPAEIWWFCNANDFGIFKNDHAGWFYLLYMTGSSSVNPFIYGVLDKKLVDVFKQSFRKKKPQAGLKARQLGTTRIQPISETRTNLLKFLNEI